MDAQTLMASLNIPVADPVNLTLADPTINTAPSETAHITPEESETILAESRQIALEWIKNNQPEALSLVNPAGIPPVIIPATQFLPVDSVRRGEQLYIPVLVEGDTRGAGVLCLADVNKNPIRLMVPFSALARLS